MVFRPFFSSHFYRNKWRARTYHNIHINTHTDTRAGDWILVNILKSECEREKLFADNNDLNDNDYIIFFRVIASDERRTNERAKK